MGLWSGMLIESRVSKCRGMEQLAWSCYNKSDLSQTGYTFPKYDEEPIMLEYAVNCQIAQVFTFNKNVNHTPNSDCTIS